MQVFPLPGSSRSLFDRDSGFKDPFLDDVDGQILPSSPRQSQIHHCWQRWRVTAVSTLGLGASLAVRILDCSKLTNGLSSFGAGLFAASVLSSCYKGRDKEQIRKITQTLCGVIPLFFLSQIWANSSTVHIKAGATHSIIACLGVNVQMFGQWLYEKGGFIRLESQPHEETREERFNLDSYFSERGEHILKVIASGAGGAFYFLIDDPVSKGIFAFWSLFYASQVVGERWGGWIDRKIEENDQKGASFSEVQGTRYRKLKTVLNTFGCMAIPLISFPWGADPHTPSRAAQLFIVGGFIGLFDGMMFQNLYARLKNVPVKFLNEFQKLPIPGEVRDSPPPFRYLAYRVWQIAVPLLTVGGLVGFTVWQESSVIQDLNSKVSLGVMLGGFLGTFALSNVVDWTWNPDKRHYLRDKLMTTLLVAPRVFGINPLYIYIAGANALAMDNSEIQRGESGLHMGTIVVSWIAYGSAMALELQRTWGMRVGAVFHFPMMVIFNGAMTMKLSIAGEGGVD